MDKKKVRGRRSYGYWERKYERLVHLNAQPIGKVMKAMWEAINENNGFHYEHLALASWESLELFAKDKGFKL